MRTTHLTRPRSRHQAGLTIVELMIAIVLGLLTVLIVSQVLLQAETRRRTIASGSDAQLNGALTLFTLQRDIQMAGYGANALPKIMGCKLTRHFSSGSATATALAPVVITAGVNGAPDSLTVLQARTRLVSMPIETKENHTDASDHFVAAEGMQGVSKGDIMVVAPESIADYASSDCRLFQVDGDTSDATVIPHEAPTDATAGSWNHASTFPAALAAKSLLINMGAPMLRTYSVDASQNLTATDVSWDTGDNPSQNLVSQIVNLQALYGKDTNADGVVDTYDKTTPTTPDGWRQVLAVRIAVVARSDKLEVGNVTAAQPSWDVGAQDTFSGVTTTDCGVASKCIALKVNHLPNWQRYRYKVYDTVVPLRNVLWHS